MQLQSQLTPHRPFILILGVVPKKNSVILVLFLIAQKTTLSSLSQTKKTLSSRQLTPPTPNNLRAC
jgi:hypothetical protein